MPSLRSPVSPRPSGRRGGVEDLSLVVPRGAIYGLIGPSGAGKTTVIRMIFSILFPHVGILAVLGKPSAVAPSLGVLIRWARMA